MTSNTHSSISSEGMPKAQVSRVMKLEATVHTLLSEVQVLREVGRRQHEFIRFGIFVFCYIIMEFYGI
jgi:hypothetical protein